jgi:drug/metabolite transporter (DMT)-like permease
VNPLRRALIALAAAGIVMGVLMVVVIAISDHVDNPTAEAVLSLLVAWSFLGHRHRRVGPSAEQPHGAPDGRVCVRLVPLEADGLEAPGALRCGLALSSIPYGVLGHLLFAFPSGRVEHPVDRFIVAVAYLLTTVYQVVVVLFLDSTTSDDCPECPPNALLVPMPRRSTTCWPECRAWSGLWSPAL